MRDPNIVDLASWEALSDTERSLVRKALTRVQELQRIVVNGARPEIDFRRRYRK